MLTIKRGPNLMVGMCLTGEYQEIKDARMSLRERVEQSHDLKCEMGKQMLGYLQTACGGETSI